MYFWLELLVYFQTTGVILTRRVKWTAKTALILVVYTPVVFSKSTSLVGSV